MGAVDKIKDILGIFDDAQDFLDEMKRNADKMRGLFSKFKSLTEGEREKINRLQSAGGNAKEVVEIMEKVDVDRPFLFGRTLLKDLQGMRRDLSKMESKIRNLPPEHRADIKAKLSKLTSVFDRGFRQHIDTIRVFSNVQRKRQEFWRGIVKSGILVAGGVVAGAALTTTAAAAVRHIVQNADKFDTSSTFLAEFLDQGLNEFGANLMGASRRVGASG